MSLVSQQHSFTNSLHSSTANHLEVDSDADIKTLPPSLPDTAEATLSTLLGAYSNDEHHLMDRGAAEYSQSGLHSPYPSALTEAQSEESSADHASAAHYTPQQEVRSNNYSTSATPTSEYGVYPTSARSSSFPEHLQRQYHPASNHSGSSGGMAQPTSPSQPDGRTNHHNSQIKSDQDVPIDPSIAASSPTYPAHGGGQYSPYPPQQEMQHGYPQHPGGAMYTQPRPDWAGYAGHPHPMQGGYPVSGAQTPTSAAPAGARPGQVYSFVPIPGAQQHKRPRRRYEEIERMYKCGWNGCEKAYGTLNHLNAHVTMQSHGQKRTPEEFKEIRKEWKARKKEEENQRKADEERARAQAVGAPTEGQPSGEGAPAQGYQPGQRAVQLPPIGYQPGSQVPGQYQAPAGGVQQLQEYSNHVQYSGYPASPYGAPNQMYSQLDNGNVQPKYEH
ncbi:hypothetical protein BGZ60DRAFT_524706 [Tricladium varicosporioides]|nr:hypothetical protein BGZ60DRAFT_524706 [Hymenoscyphus varicosporioides]